MTKRPTSGAPATSPISIRLASGSTEAEVIVERQVLLDSRFRFCFRKSSKISYQSGGQLLNHLQVPLPLYQSGTGAADQRRSEQTRIACVCLRPAPQRKGTEERRKEGRKDARTDGRTDGRRRGPHPKIWRCTQAIRRRHNKRAMAP